MTIQEHRDGDEVIFAEQDHVSFSDLMASGLFQRTYHEGMRLVEEASGYLDGPGRAAARLLPRDVSLAYAGESMRLTTRLMQVASWLLVRKSVHEGELTEEEARSEKYRLATRQLARQPRFGGVELLPIELQDLIARADRLYAQVERLDEQLRTMPEQRLQRRPIADYFRRAEAFFQESLSVEFPRPEFGRRKNRPNH